MQRIGLRQIGCCMRAAVRSGQDLPVGSGESFAGRSRPNTWLVPREMLPPVRPRSAPTRRDNAQSTDVSLRRPVIVPPPRSRMLNRQFVDPSRGLLAHPGAPHQFRDTIAYNGEECCRLGEGFGGNMSNAPPPYELARRGVTQEEWNRYMQARGG